MTAEDILIREIDGEMVILDRRAGQVHQVNATGRHIWRHLRDGFDVDSIARMLVDEYDIPLDKAEADVHGFLQQLRALGLVE